VQHPHVVLAAELGRLLEEFLRLLEFVVLDGLEPLVDNRIDAAALPHGRGL
jgi:hypothetical protein